MSIQIRVFFIGSQIQIISKGRFAAGFARSTPLPGSGCIVVNGRSLQAGWDDAFFARPNTELLPLTRPFRAARLPACKLRAPSGPKSGHRHLHPKAGSTQGRGSPRRRTPPPRRINPFSCTGDFFLQGEFPFYLKMKTSRIKRLLFPPLLPTEHSKAL